MILFACATIFSSFPSSSLPLHFTANGSPRATACCSVVLGDTIIPIIQSNRAFACIGRHNTWGGRASFTAIGFGKTRLSSHFVLSMMQTVSEEFDSKLRFNATVWADLIV